MKIPTNSPNTPNWSAGKWFGSDFHIDEFNHNGAKIVVSNLFIEKIGIPAVGDELIVYKEVKKKSGQSIRKIQQKKEVKIHQVIRTFKSKKHQCEIFIVAYDQIIQHASGNPENLTNYIKGVTVVDDKDNERLDAKFEQPKETQDEPESIELKKIDVREKQDNLEPEEKTRKIPFNIQKDLHEHMQKEAARIKSEGGSKEEQRTRLAQSMKDFLDKRKQDEDEQLDTQQEPSLTEKLQAEPIKLKGQTAIETQAKIINAEAENEELKQRIKELETIAKNAQESVKYLQQEVDDLEKEAEQAQKINTAENNQEDFLMFKKHDGTIEDRSRLLLQLKKAHKDELVTALRAKLKWDNEKQQLVERFKN